MATWWEKNSLGFPRSCHFFCDSRQDRTGGWSHPKADSTVVEENKRLKGESYVSETKMLSFWGNYCHQLHRKLAFDTTSDENFIKKATFFFTLFQISICIDSWGIGTHMSWTVKRKKREKSQLEPMVQVVTFRFFLVPILYLNQGCFIVKRVLRN